jgi:hypothetical protein
MISKNNNPRTKRRRTPRVAALQTDLPQFRSGEDFDALSSADKERVARFYAQGRHRSEMRALTAAERTEQKRERAMAKKGSHAKIRKTVAKEISISVEPDLLKRADAFAKAHGLNRAELFHQALNQLLPLNS